MKNITYILLLISNFLIAQELAPTQEQAYIYEGNESLITDDFVNAEAAYRNAISENPVSTSATYNLGNAYLTNNKTDEAITRYKQAQKTAKTKAEKHKAYHNTGNALMQQKKYDNAIEAYKNALRNIPTDNETRYNLALAKKMKEEQDKNNEDNKDNKNDQNNKDDKKDQDKKEDNKNDKDSDKKDDKGDKDNQKNKDKDEDSSDKDPKDKGDKDKDQQKDNKSDQNKDKKESPKPKEGQLSPQQIQNLLEAMNNQEKKLQEKMNAKKAKGTPATNEKDW